MIVDANRYLAPANDIAARMLGDELMVMSGLDSSLFCLNPTAALLWNAADGVTPLAQIVDEQIVARFDVGFAEALRDAIELAEGLSRHGILILSSAPIPDARPGCGDPQ